MLRRKIIITVASSTLSASLAFVPSAFASQPETCPKGTAWSNADEKCLKPEISEYASGAPKKGTGGLIFRDEKGNDLGSGMGESDRFRITGKAVKVGGEYLVEVEQVTRGQGGWGDLYKGYVKLAYTDVA